MSLTITEAITWLAALSFVQACEEACSLVKIRTESWH